MTTEDATLFVIAVFMSFFAGLFAGLNEAEDRRKSKRELEPPADLRAKFRGEK